METRREFLKKAALLTGATVMWGAFPESIQRALAINPETGSTFLDAEHIVILMQENRSFDHSYGTLQGVRGYGDPRAHVLPNLNPVWCQSNSAGETFAPFRLDIHETNVTWTGSLPHSWGDQVDAMNKGAYDRWLRVKGSGNKAVSNLPMTLGHYTREDIPFYYSFADAFTICDQHFCSSLTGTTPNRLYLWTGTIRNATGMAHVYNGEADYDSPVDWKTFPERLEDQGISWKIYQNELSIESGLSGAEDSWLANYGDNPIEYFTQYNVRFSKPHREYLAKRTAALPGEIEKIETLLRLADMTEEEGKKQAKRLADLRAEQKAVAEETVRWSVENWEKLSPREKRLHERAFAVNSGDPRYRELTSLAYGDDGTQRVVQGPAGDVLHHFREDVKSGQLPTVSWLVAPENFSDHPSSAWYGAWYVSETLDILTQNPEVWKKTIFILTYDENDGYFDHVVPFAAPNPADPSSGKVSEGIDAATEYITAEEDKKSRPNSKPRDNSIGLGYRVPMVVASPWSRGGCVCSEVFDHTSVLQFLEVFLSHKKKKVQETNISSWRRAVCGDLTSVFQPYKGEPVSTPASLDRNSFIQGIHAARFKKAPGEVAALSAAEVAEIAAKGLTAQEPGTRKSAPLPYQLFADGGMVGKRFELRLRSARSGAPFNVYSYLPSGEMKMRAYALEGGKSLSDAWDLEGDSYWIRVDGPNGFMREFKGLISTPLEVSTGYSKGLIQISVTNSGSDLADVRIEPHAYGHPVLTRTLKAGESTKLVVDTASSHGWYDFSVVSSGFERRCSGRVETGVWGTTDPAMGAAKGSP